MIEYDSPGSELSSGHSRPLLSVVIAARNPPPDWVPVRCETDVCQPDRTLRMQDVEFVLVDDASTNDDARAMADNLATLAPTRFLKRRVSSGIGDARYLGISHATGRYVLFADADDTVLIPAILNVARVASACHWDAVHFLSTTTAWGSRFASTSNVGGCDEHLPPHRYRRLTCLLLKRSSLWRFLFRLEFITDHAQVLSGGSLGEDLLAMLELSGVIREVPSIPVICYVHHLGVPGSASSSPPNSAVKTLRRDLAHVSLSRGPLDVRLTAMWWIVKTIGVQSFRRAQRTLRMQSPAH